MREQLHRKFLDEQVKSLLERYVSKEIKINYILEILGIKRRRFFELVKDYRKILRIFQFLTGEKRAIER